MAAPSSDVTRLAVAAPAAAQGAGRSPSLALPPVVGCSASSRAAYEHLASGKHFGKVIIRVD